MKRSQYFDFIEEKLNFLSFRIETRGQLNILNLHLHSEGFYQDLLNLLFDWRLINLNTIEQNAEAIDLIDKTKQILVQVSATATKAKIESSLSKDLSKYSGYNFKFMSIAKDAKALRNQTYKNPWNLEFNPQTDIFDIPSLLRIVLSSDTGRRRSLYEFIKKELGTEIEPQKIESNLATIIEVIAREDWNKPEPFIETRDFAIEEKITYNQLDSARALIDDYKIHVGRIDKIYGEFDRQGANKSLSVLDGMRRIYSEHKNKSANPDKLFFDVIDTVTQRIRDSANFNPIPSDELDLCVAILVVDAFIRCKIFKNPVGNTDADS
jgi:hypothetical protein